MAVTAQRGQRIGARQGVHLQLIQLRAQHQIVRAVEWTSFSGVKESLDAVFRETAHQTQAEAHGGMM
jgi:hypothetical protein